MIPKLTDVSSKYGAPMGRRDHATETDKPIKLHLYRLPFIDLCYDTGGAYWGMPANIYRAVGYGTEELQEIFVRANSRNAAKTKVLQTFPHAKFYR